MEEEDKEFFVLVLGVLAAILMVISWWFTTGGIAVSSAQVIIPAESNEASATTDSHNADEASSQDGAADGGAGDGADTPAASAADPNNRAVSSDDPEPEPTVALASSPSAFDAIADNAQLTVLSDLLRTEGLDSVLASDGPFTVFAPTNDAISSAAGSDTTVVVLETARADVLTYHVVPGSYSIEDLAEIARGSRSTELATVQGETLSIALEGNTLVINGTAVVGADPILSENGWVHTVNDVLIPPVAALNTLVEVDPILFSAGSATIADASFATLDQIITVLQRNNVSVAIAGHTDSSGDPILNENLSQSRARSVLNYLVANGVDESRLSAVGFGSSAPVADNNTEAGRALNRRIEFTLDENSAP